MTRRRKTIIYFLLDVLISTALFVVGPEFIPTSLRSFTVKAEDPMGTYQINSAEEFAAYSRAYARGDKNREDVLNVAITSGSIVTDLGFISLGTSQRPFAGTINVTAVGIGTFHLFNCPLFNYVSTDATIKVSGDSDSVQIIREKLPDDNIPDGVLTSGALFANHVVKGDKSAGANWDVTLAHYEGGGESRDADSYACFIGDIEGGCKVTVKFTNNTAIPVSASSDAGLICGTLGEGAALTVTTAGSGGNISVTSSGGNAGSLVGRMKEGSTLTLNSGNLSRVNSVTSSRGYAGGLVGFAEEVTVKGSAYAVSGTVSGNSGAGGIFGYYKKTGDFTFDMAGISDELADFSITSGMTITGSGNSGGVFGYLENGGGAFEFDGNSESITVTVSGGTYRGGIVGAYKASALTDTFNVHDVLVSATLSGGSSSAKGGLIGLLNNASYVHIYNNTVTSNNGNGGLVGSAEESGVFIDITGSNTVSGSNDACVIGKLNQGVLRIAGTTDISGLSASGGQIVNTRGNSLVYALGNGEGTGWTLKRNLSNAIDDMGSWGEVLRVHAGTFAESDLFTVDMTAHTVTLKAAATSMGTKTQFALTALNIQLNTTTAVGSGALRFTADDADKSATLLGGTLTFTADISLAGTGLTGLTRDNNSGVGTTFSGTINGGNHTITLATGEKYGLNDSGNALAADSKQGNIFTHTHSGLLAKTSGATIGSLTVSGNMIINQKADNLYAGGLVAEASGALALSNFTANLTLSYKTNGDYNFAFGGAIGTASGNNLGITATGCSFV